MFNSVCLYFLFQIVVKHILTHCLMHLYNDFFALSMFYCLESKHNRSPSEICLIFVVASGKITQHKTNLLPQFSFSLCSYETGCLRIAQENSMWQFLWIHLFGEKTNRLQSFLYFSPTLEMRSDQHLVFLLNINQMCYKLLHFQWIKWI